MSTFFVLKVNTPTQGKWFIVNYLPASPTVMSRLRIAARLAVQQRCRSSNLSEYNFTETLIIQYQISNDQL